jgi:hypothetical protein
MTWAIHAPTCSAPNSRQLRPRPQTDGRADQDRAAASACGCRDAPAQGVVLQLPVSRVVQAELMRMAERLVARLSGLTGPATSSQRGDEQASDAEIVRPGGGEPFQIGQDLAVQAKQEAGFAARGQGGQAGLFQAKRGFDSERPAARVDQWPSAPQRQCVGGATPGGPGVFLPQAEPGQAGQIHERVRVGLDGRQLIAGSAREDDPARRAGDPPSHFRNGRGESGPQGEHSAAQAGRGLVVRFLFRPRLPLKIVRCRGAAGRNGEYEGEHGPHRAQRDLVALPAGHGGTEQADGDLCSPRLPVQCARRCHHGDNRTIDDEKIRHTCRQSHRQDQALDSGLRADFFIYKFCGAFFRGDQRLPSRPAWRREGSLPLPLQHAENQAPVRV